MVRHQTFYTTTTSKSLPYFQQPNSQRNFQFQPDFQSQMKLNINQPHIPFTNQNPQRFPSHPIHLQPTSTQQKCLSTDEQVFRPAKKNVFDSIGQISSNTPKPMFSESNNATTTRTKVTLNYWQPRLHRRRTVGNRFNENLQENFQLPYPQDRKDLNLHEENIHYEQEIDESNETENFPYKDMK